MSKLPILETCRFATNGTHCGNCDRDLSDCWSLAPISPPAQKPVSELGGSGAGLVGNPSSIFDFCDTLPATMSGDAWESAALHVLAMRQKHLHNVHAWLQIGAFLESSPTLPRRAEPCLFPQPKFEPPEPFFTGLAYFSWQNMRKEFSMEAYGASIDAPVMLPRGSVDSMRFGNTVNAFSHVERP